MKGLIKVVVLAGLVVGCSTAKQGNLVGRAAPDVRLALIDEEPKLLSDFIGQPTYILFWGTWCSASQAALSRFRELSVRRSDNFIAVSGDSDDKDLSSWLERNGRGKVRYVFSGNQIADETFLAFDVKDVPELVALDGSGNVVYQGDFDKFSKW